MHKEGCREGLEEELGSVVMHVCNVGSEQYLVSLLFTAKSILGKDQLKIAAGKGTCISRGGCSKFDQVGSLTTRDGSFN